MSALDDALSWVLADQRNELEVLCWQALRENAGIAIIQGPLESFEEGAISYRMTETYRIDPRVPAMNIYRFPDEKAYDAWVERGCPTR